MPNYSFWKLFPSINLNCKGDRVLQSVLCQKSHCCLVVLIALMYCTSKTLFQQDHKMNFFFLNLTVCLSYSVNAETAPWLISRKPVQKPAAALSSFSLAAFAVQVMQLVLQSRYLHWNTPLRSALGRNRAACSTEINVAARL